MSGDFLQSAEFRNIIMPIRPQLASLISGGVAVPANDRYAFVTQERVGSESGAVGVIDRRSLTEVATIDIGQQAGGIAFLKTTAPR